MVAISLTCWYTSFCHALHLANAATSVAHTTNLHVLTPVLPAHLLSEFSAATTFEMPPNFTLPEIQVFKQNDHQLRHAFIDLNTAQINLTAIINNTLNNGFVYRSRSDKLSHDLAILAFNCTRNPLMI